MARLKRPADAASPKGKTIKQECSSGAESEEEEETPAIRHSSRLAAKAKAKAAAAAVAAADTSGSRSKTTSAADAAPAAKRRRALSPRAARAVAAEAAAARKTSIAEKRKKEEEEAAVRRRRREEEEEEGRRAREAAEVERRRAREQEQREFDDRVAAFFARLEAVGAQPNPTTSQAGTRQLAVVDALLNDVLLAMRTAGDADTGTLQIALDEVRVKKQRLQTEVFILAGEEREAEGVRRAEVARQRAAEEARRAEESRQNQEEKERMEEGMKEEGGKEGKDEEEEETKMMEEERREKQRMEESMLDKECRICFDEIKDGVGCMLCANVIGCKACMDEWLKQESTCPFCRRNLTNVTKQIKKADEVLRASAKKAARAAIPVRRSVRGRPSTQNGTE